MSKKKRAEAYEELLGEVAILRCRLEGKTEALLILSKEQEKLRSERDQFKLMAEQLRERYTILRKKVEGWGPSLVGAYDSKSIMQEQSLAQLLCEFKDQNQNLQSQVADLKQKLEDANGDIKVLREQIARQRVGSIDSTSSHFPLYEKEHLVQQLEEVRKKNEQMERDLQSVLDEKEELIVARDALNRKVERLNLQLTAILGSPTSNGSDKIIVDIDSVIMENRFLQDQLKQAQEENAIIKGLLAKYKSLLEKKRPKGVLKFGSGTNLLVTNKQIQQLLTTNPTLDLPPNPSTIAELKALVLGLFEALNDKALSLAHHKKTNKILGTRITDLEKKIQDLESCSFRWKLSEKMGLHLDKRAETTDTKDEKRLRAASFTDLDLLPTRESPDVLESTYGTGKLPRRYLPTSRSLGSTPTSSSPSHQGSPPKDVPISLDATHSQGLLQTSVEGSFENDEAPLPDDLQRMLEEALRKLDVPSPVKEFSNSGPSSSSFSPSSSLESPHC